MRVRTSCPMSTLRLESERPKSQREQRHRTLPEASVSRELRRALFSAVPVQRLVVAALGLPLVDLLLRDALAADVQARHVVGRVDGEEQEEGEQVDADQDRAARSRQRRIEVVQSSQVALHCHGERRRRRAAPWPARARASCATPAQPAAARRAAAATAATRSAGSMRPACARARPGRRGSTAPCRGSGCSACRCAPTAGTPARPHGK